MEPYEERIERAADAIAGADHIVVGGGAGLSEAAGASVAGPAFERNFAAFIERYGIRDLYSAGFYPYPTPEEKWAFWAKHIYHSYYEPEAPALYRDVRALLEGKEHFVVTTNVDGLFGKAGFDMDRVFEVQGSFGHFQCAKPCSQTLYDNESAVRQMVGRTDGCRIPPELVPKCPNCGGEMDYHLRVDGRFVEDEAWRERQCAYHSYLADASEGRTVLFELGVGFNTPGIIRWPFERIAYSSPETTIVRLNRDFPDGAPENEAKTVAFAEDMSRVVRDLTSVLA